MLPGKWKKRPLTSWIHNQLGTGWEDTVFWLTCISEGDNKGAVEIAWQVGGSNKDYAIVASTLSPARLKILDKSYAPTTDYSARDCSKGVKGSNCKTGDTCACVPMIGFSKPSHQTGSVIPVELSSGTAKASADAAAGFLGTLKKVTDACTAQVKAIENAVATDLEIKNAEQDPVLVKKRNDVRAASKARYVARKKEAADLRAARLKAFFDSSPPATSATTTPGKPATTTPGKPTTSGKPATTTPGKPATTSPGKATTVTPPKLPTTTTGKATTATPPKPVTTPVKPPVAPIKKPGKL